VIFFLNLFPVWQPYCWRFWSAIVPVHTSTINAPKKGVYNYTECFFRVNKKYHTIRTVTKRQKFIHIQSNLSCVTFQENIEIWSHRTDGCLIQVKLIWNALWQEIEIKVTQYKLLLNRGGHYSKFDCIYIHSCSVSCHFILFLI
jgi:hypothetical protein